MIPKAPEGLLTVQFEKGVKANLGNTLSIEQSKKKPVDLSWRSSQEAFYTVVMTDPDAPSRRNATFAEFKHWIVGNIPGLKINEGKIIADYRPPSPPKGKRLSNFLFKYRMVIYKVLFQELDHIGTYC